MCWCVIFDKLTFSGCCFLWRDVNFCALAYGIMLASRLSVALTADEAIDSILCVCSAQLLLLSLPQLALCRASFFPQGWLGPHSWELAHLPQACHEFAFSSSLASCVPALFLTTSSSPRFLVVFCLPWTFSIIWLLLLSHLWTLFKSHLC